MANKSLFLDEWYKLSFVEMYPRRATADTMEHYVCDECGQMATVRDFAKSHKLELLVEPCDDRYMATLQDCYVLGFSAICSGMGSTEDKAFNALGSFISGKKISHKVGNVITYIDVPKLDMI